MFKRKKTKGKKRPIAVTVIGMAIVVLFIVRLYQVFRPLYDMGMFQYGLMGPFTPSTGLTEAGQALVDSIFYFILAIGLVIVLIGFLRMRRWSWVMLMTWVGILDGGRPGGLLLLRTAQLRHHGLGCGHRLCPQPGGSATHFWNKDGHR